MSEDLLNIEVDGVPLQARKGQMLIEVTDANHVHVPRFCYHRKLSVAANCRMCLVEVEKAPKPLPACATPVAEGMKVFTRSPFALRAQKAVMEFLLINHPLDCPICDQGGECELQDLSMGYGRDVSRFQERKRVVRDENVGPLIQTDLTRCIQCTRCVRFGEEIGGRQELGMVGRGEHEEIRTFIERSVDSELSGNVIDLCPVGALTSKPFRFRARAWEMRQYPTIAPHDCVGSNVHVHTAHRRVMRVVPREHEELNEVWLSDRDRFSYSGLYSEDRLERPAIKREGRWESVDWEDALAFTAQGLRGAMERAGAARVGALASPCATLEEHYLLQRLLRAMGSGNVDHRLRQTDFADQDAAPLFPGLGQELPALERAQAVLLVGSNTRKEQPLVNHRLRKAALCGARVMALNPVDYPFNYPLDAKLVVDPGRMVETLAGIAAALGTEKARDRFAGLLSGIRPGEEERAVAERLRDAERAVILLGSGAAAHPRASLLRALADCVAERSGAVAGLLPDGANGAGAWLAGAVPHRGPGGTAARPQGLNAREMLEAPLQAYVLLGMEPELDCADGAGARAALGQAQFVACLGGYRTPAMEEYADVLLPIALFAENEGTFVNAVGQWQSFDAVAPRPGESRPAWKILRVLGNLLEAPGFDYVQVEDVRGELRSLIEGAGSPSPEKRPVPEGLADDAGAIAGELLYRIGDVPPYSTDPVVRRSTALQQTADAIQAGVYLNADTAAKLGLVEGAAATVVQGEARAELPVFIDGRVADRCAHIPSGVPGTAGLGAAFGEIRIETS